MKFDPALHHRRSIRLRGYDYAHPGAYFVTICTRHRECLFGTVVQGQMQMNNVGRMIHSTWYELPQHYPGVEIDSFVVMPNHIHGIIRLTWVPQGQARGPAPTMSLPGVIHRLKSLTTTRYRKGIIETGRHEGDETGRRRGLEMGRVAPATGLPLLWQRNYYEHIIRSEDALNKIREYICSNPLGWPYDPENPAHSEAATDGLEDILARDRYSEDR